MEDRFLTLTSPAEGYFMERGSKFLAYVFPVEAEDDTVGIMQKIKKEHPKARHFCTALRIHPDASLERSNDDGEPSGSAGRPILGQLIKNNLTNIFVIVVRYFGGTKLGIPGLIEAYKTSTANALEAGVFIEKNVFTLIQVTVPYESFPHYLNFFKQHDIPVFEESFADQASLKIGFRKSTATTELIRALQDYSKMDYAALEDYTHHLDIEINFLNEDQIL